MISVVEIIKAIRRRVALYIAIHPIRVQKKYGNAKDFDYLEFWETMRKWSRHNNIVLISELQAPGDFITIWEKEVDRSMKAKEHFRATEKLFMWGGVTVND